MIAGRIVESNQAVNESQIIYQASYMRFTDDTCTVGLSKSPIGPCWEGEGAGYEGFYWKFSCDEEFKIYEQFCGRTNTNCTESDCQEPIWWGEKANLCIQSGEQYYLWRCTLPDLNNIVFSLKSYILEQIDTWTAEYQE